MNKIDFLFMCAIIILMTIVGFAFGSRYQQEKDGDIINEYYKTYCIAMPGQVSIMKWVDGIPQCTRIETPVKHGDNLKDWKNEYSN